MSRIDPAAERQRLQRLYASIEDTELLQLSAQADTLTDVARQALSDEMRHRHMELPAVSKPRDVTVDEVLSTQARSEVEGETTAPEPILLRRYRDLPIAQLAKATLDSAGIESFLVDENLVRLDWFYSNLVGGVKLFVRSEDAAEASKVLDDVVPADVENQDSPE